MIKIKRGLDIPIQGAPEQTIEDAPAARAVALVGFARRLRVFGAQFGEHLQVTPDIICQHDKLEICVVVFEPGRRDGIEAFAGLGVDVVGISNDSAESHREFRQKHDLPFTLLTDPDLKVAAMYDSKGVLGMKRSVFLVDEEGVIRYLHVESVALFRRKREELLDAIRNIS